MRQEWLRYELLVPVLLMSFVLKVILLFTITPFGFPDGGAYMGGAEMLYSNGFLWHREVNNEAPLGFYYYALFHPLAEIIGPKGYVVGNLFVATATIAVGYKIALLLFDKSVANLSAIVMAVYPYFNFYAIHPLLETPFVLLLYLAFYFSFRVVIEGSISALYGFVLFFALTVLAKFSGLPMFPLLLLLLLYFIFRKHGTLRTVKVGLISMILFASVMSPWWVRNAMVHGEFVATSVGESGKVLYTGNNPMNKSGGGITGIDVEFGAFDHIEDLVERDMAMKQAALEWIKENPLDWAYLVVKKFIRLYSPVIFTDYFSNWKYQALSLMSYGMIFVLFIYSLFLFRPVLWKVSPFLLYMLLLTGVHLVFIASLRYRLPLEPFMIIMGIAALLKLLSRRSHAAT